MSRRGSCLQAHAFHLFFLCLYLLTNLYYHFVEESFAFFFCLGVHVVGFTFALGIGWREPSFPYFR